VPDSTIGFVTAFNSMVINWW